MYIGLHAKYLLFLSDLNEIWNFSTVFSKNTQISNWMKILLVGTELLHADRRDGRTEITKLIFALREFSNAPNNKQV